MLQNILLIVTYFMCSESSIAVSCKTCSLTFISQSTVVSNREESVLGYKSLTSCIMTHRWRGVTIN